LSGNYVLSAGKFSSSYGYVKKVAIIVEDALKPVQAEAPA